jgi:hypothetical protein
MDSVIKVPHSRQPKMERADKEGDERVSRRPKMVPIKGPQPPSIAN